jgi:hypothetical protein
VAIYHLSVKPVSRSAGRSATAAAAYRAGERGAPITDQRTGEVHDYTRKRGVLCAEIVLPQSLIGLPGANDGGGSKSPVWAQDRASLWNAAELAEKRKDACVAREYEVALPAELPAPERQRLVLDFAREMANREGCAVDVCIHEPGRGGDDRNHHAHLLRTTRRVEAQGLGAKLDTEKAGRNRVADLEFVRQCWAELTNERLREAGLDGRVDHRSLQDQGIEREPTKHLGPAATGYERRTGRASDNRMRLEEVAERLALARQAGELEREGRQLDSAIIDLSGDLDAALREREHGREREAEVKRKLDALTAADVGKLIERMRPAPTSQLVARDPAVVEARAREVALGEELGKVRAREAEIGREVWAWRAANPLRAKMHDAGVLQAPYLVERAQAAGGAAKAAVRLAGELEAARAAADLVRQAAQVRAEQAAAAKRQELKVWEQLRRAKEIQEGRAAQERRQAQDRVEVPREFADLAARRAARLGGFADGGAQWAATPAALRALIDAYNAQPAQTREKVLRSMAADAGKAREVGALLEQRQENVRQLDRGRDRDRDLER